MSAFLPSPAAGSMCRAQSGVSMIEVLVAVLVMGIGMLGMAAMQTTALRNSQSSLERSQAAMQAYAILDAMRANADQARIGAYNLNTWTCSPPAAGGTLAQQDLNGWFRTMQADLALGNSACAQIACGRLGCQVDIRWDDSHASGNDEPERFTTRTRL